MRENRTSGLMSGGGTGNAVKGAELQARSESDGKATGP